MHKWNYDILFTKNGNFFTKNGTKNHINLEKFYFRSRKNKLPISLK